jgi:RNA-binding, Nab2-type zinc finger
MVPRGVPSLANVQVGNAKTKDHINSELSELIGEDFDPAFTDWLFNEIDELSYYQSNGHETHDDSMETENQQSESPESSSRRSLKEAPSSARSAADPYPQPSRIRDQINRHLERPAVPIKRSIPDIPNVPTGPRALSSAGPIRRGRGGGGRQQQMPPVQPNFGAFLSMATGMPPEMVQQMMAETANFPNPNPMFGGFPPMNLSERITDIPVDGSLGIVATAGERNRCRHWPRCSLGARCKFHHPSQICPYVTSVEAANNSAFPNCPNMAGTCPNIHVGEDIPQSELHRVINGTSANGHRPLTSSNGNASKKPQRPKKAQEQVPLCKYGAKCTKPECVFAHPTPAGGPDAIVLRGEMCPDGRGCQNAEVLYIQTKLIQCDMGHPSPVVDSSKRKETEMCKFFPNCTNPECTFKQYFL